MHCTLLFTMLQAALLAQRWRLKAGADKQPHSNQHIRRVTRPFGGQEPFHCRGPPRWPSGKASVSRAEDPGFESCLRRDFFRGRVESYSDSNIGTPVATLPGALCYWVSAGTGRPGASILWLGEVES